MLLFESIYLVHDQNRALVRHHREASILYELSERSDVIALELIVSIRSSIW